MKKTKATNDKRINLRIKKEHFERLEKVADNIANDSRGEKPDLAKIIFSILGWGNRKLVSDTERMYIAGDIPALHGKFAPVSRPASTSKSKVGKG